MRHGSRSNYIEDIFSYKNNFQLLCCFHVTAHYHLLYEDRHDLKLQTFSVLYLEPPNYLDDTLALANSSFEVICRVCHLVLLELLVKDGE